MTADPPRDEGAAYHAPPPLPQGAMPYAAAPPPVGEPVPLPPPLDAVPWRRLSVRMLLVHPVREMARALPALLGLLVAGTSTGSGQQWVLLGVVGVVGFSILRWFTTRFRITPDQVQLRTGLLRRRAIATPADRVRSVDVTASPLHRLLGLAKVQIGTGDKDSGLELDSLTAGEARSLRAELLHRAQRASPGAIPLTDDLSGAEQATRSQAPVIPDAQETELLRLDPRWIRFAPFTASGLVAAAATAGIGWRLVDEIGGDPGRLGVFRWLQDRLVGTSIWLDVLQGLLALTALVTLLAVGGYVLAYWGFALTRHARGTLHVSRGLLTTRSTSIEERRLRGVELNDTLLLRLVRGARLEAVTTGLGGHPGQEGSRLLVPPAPVAVVRTVAAGVLRDHASLDCPLTQHGPAARRRRLVRALMPVGLLAVVVAAGTVRADLPAWLLLLPLALVPVGLLLGADRYRSLGHAVSGDFLVTRSGSLDRSRSVLARDGIIGWNLAQSWFQRRSGLATLTATTAAGDQAYPVVDVPAERALDVARMSTPGLLEQFIEAR